MAIGSNEFKAAMGRFASGVTIVTTVRGGRPVGMTASAFCSLSLDPPLVLFCLDKGAQCHDLFAAGECFAVSILAEDQLTLSERFAQPFDDRFEGVAVECLETGAPVLPDALAVADCWLHAVHDGGDHSILVGRVVAVSVREDDTAPLLHYRGAYRKLA